MNRNKFYVTTPIYYVNSKPHIGTLYSTLLADVSARWNKLCGKKTYFLTGSDEHGQKIATAAENAKTSPQEFVDKIVPEFKRIWSLYEIEYNNFIRTTDKEHEKAVQKWILKLLDNGDIYKSQYSGQYCVPCETFVTNSENNLCPTCNRALIELAEESYFFRLSAYQERLLEFYEKNPDFIVPKERLNEVISFVKSGLKDLSISRKNVKWGIPFPTDPEHTVYVWGDALNNYISAIGYGSEDKTKEENFKFWWPADLQIMAKDIVKFHAIYWPAFLMAAELDLPKKLLVHGYILSGSQKMSKSLGNVMDPETLANWYGVEPVRYYLLRQMAINQDGQFDLKDLESKIGSDLANNLGNLLNRTITLAINNNLKEVKAPKNFSTETLALREKCEEAFRNFWDNMNHYQYHVALAELWRFISEINSYIQAQEPWNKNKHTKESFEEVIYTSCHSLYSVGVLLWPIMPNKITELLDSLGHKFNLENNYTEELRKNIWNKTFVLKKSENALFARPETHVEIEEAKIEPKDKKTKTKSIEQEKQKNNTITIEDVIKIELITGTILECEPVSGSDKLYKLLVDFGKLGKRQILSGVAQNFKPEDFIGKIGVYVGNLAPRKMMGMVSEGMMLFAKDDKGNMKFVTVSGNVENGTRLS